jgi:NAD(P)-dependent dehydrogenase (short-subunit alcohol dehydrogenase family)
MRIDLSGRTALVTGSTAGIGFAVARGLVQAGADVVVNGRTGERVEAAVARLLDERPEATLHGVAADLGDAVGVRGLLDVVPDVDILVNNLGVYESKPFEEITDDDWFRLFEVNVMSGVRLSRHYLSRMVERQWGRIIFVSSASGVQIPPDMVHYGATKAAVLAVARGIAEGVPESGVTVNSVLPGPTASEGVERFFRDLARQRGQDHAVTADQFIQGDRPSSLLRRLSDPAEVANMVVYACSQQASFTTGSALRVDGGIVRAIL